MRDCRTQPGFTLVELTLAIAMIGLLGIGLIGMLTQGLDASQDAEDRTLTGLMMEDIRKRTHGIPLVEGMSLWAASQRVSSACWRLPGSTFAARRAPRNCKS